MNTTRRQHYVWKHYLRLWERAGRVAVLRKETGATFETDASNIAVARDFYRLPILSQEDENFLEKFIESTSNSELLKKLNRGWLDSVATTSRLRRRLERLGKLDPSIVKEIERAEIQSEESFLSRIESDAVGLIDALHSGRSDVWREDDSALNLAYFLSLQHLRTKRMRDRTAEAFPNDADRQAFVRRWPVLRHVLITNMGWSLYSERIDWRLRILKASEEAPFITGDQPTLNLLPADSHNGLALYYPVGPLSAAILEHRENKSAVGDLDDLPIEVVENLNRRIYEFSHEQVFGVDVSHLKFVSR